MSGQGGFWDAVNVAMVAIPVAGAAGMIGLKALNKARSWGLKACNCFVTGTLITTAQGELPIELIRAGDAILTLPEDSPSKKPDAGTVTAIEVAVSPTIVWITLANGRILGATPGHEVWTFEEGWTHIAELAVGDSFQDADGLPLAIISLRVDESATQVYNLRVDGTFTYYAEGVWVHNNSCRRVLNVAFDLFNVKKLSKSQLTRKPPRRGAAPKGIDGQPVNIHHINQNPDGPFEEILLNDHRRIRNPNPGLSQEERRVFDRAKERYWEREWDARRFDDLPE